MLKMNNIYKICAAGCLAFGLAACQTTSNEYNGLTGFQVESQTANSATIAYTLAGRQDRQKDENKLQNACQKTLGSSKKYQLAILSANEIANPKAAQDNNYGRQIGNSRTSFGLSNTPDLHNSENLATRDALDTRPATLRVIRYTCS